jgi:hypothetical protein
MAVAPNARRTSGGALMTQLLKDFSLDWQTLTVIAVLCVCSAYFIREYMANPTLIIFVYPLLFLFSVLTQYLFIVMELYPPKKLDAWLMWTIMATIIGNFVGTCLVAALVNLRERLGSRAT